MSSKRKMPFAIKTGYLTVITIIVWIVFEVIKILMTKPPVQVSAEILSPLDPTLDEVTLNKLQGRVYLPDDNVSINVSVPSTTPAPTASPIPAVPGGATP